VSEKNKIRIETKFHRDDKGRIVRIENAPDAASVLLPFLDDIREETAKLGKSSRNLEFLTLALMLLTAVLAYPILVNLFFRVP
jgi:hypothetical protein